MPRDAAASASAAAVAPAQRPAAATSVAPHVDDISFLGVPPTAAEMVALAAPPKAASAAAASAFARPLADAQTNLSFGRQEHEAAAADTDRGGPLPEADYSSECSRDAADRAAQAMARAACTAASSSSAAAAAEGENRPAAPLDNESQEIAMATAQAMAEASKRDGDELAKTGFKRRKQNSGGQKAMTAFFGSRKRK